MGYIYPDLDWYTKISKENKVPPRCPYANVHRCPRFYASLYLLGEGGITTKIKPEKIKELDLFWERSDLLPVVAEHDTGVQGKVSFWNFCPEVSFEIFGLFAEYLTRYADEIDQDSAHAELAKNAYPKDWRWHWRHVEPMHYLKCPIYSQLLSKPTEASQNSQMQQTSQEMIEVKPGFMGINLNIKVLFTRLANWWLSKQKH